MASDEDVTVKVQFSWDTWIEKMQEMAKAFRNLHTSKVLNDVRTERVSQDAKWGIQHHPDGTSEDNKMYADLAKQRCEAMVRQDALSWRDILDEEVAEAYAETDPVKLRAELVQVSAVVVAWIEDIDSREEKDNG